MLLRYSEDSLSPEKLEILQKTDLARLCDLLRICQKKTLPREGLVDEIEKEIYKKWIKKNNMEDCYKYKLTTKLYYADVLRDHNRMSEK